MHKEREKDCPICKIDEEYNCDCICHTWSTNLKDQAKDTKKIIDMGVIGIIEIRRS